MMALFDSHCHVDEPKFDDDREDVLTRMTEAGVTRYAVIGSDMATSPGTARISQRHIRAAMPPSASIRTRRRAS